MRSLNKAAKMTLFLLNVVFPPKKVKIGQKINTKTN